MADVSEHRGRAAGDGMEMSNSYRALQIMLTIMDINLRAMVIVFLKLGKNNILRQDKMGESL